MLNRAWIMAHIPHQGSMCLLEEVMHWSTDLLQCRATSHRLMNNPLREQGRLGIACGIEYAAQAMAIHGALLGDHGVSPRQGYLTSVRGVQLHAHRLDDVVSDLKILIHRLSGDERLVLYQFELSGDDRTLIEGKATVVLDVQKL